ncbi:cytochrome P450 [Nocardia sp. NPDC055053]
MSTNELGGSVYALPTQRPHGCPFAVPAELSELQRTEPISRMTFPDGHQGWLVANHELARLVLTDPAFSSRPDLQHIPLAPPGAAPALPPAVPGQLSSLDPPEHSRYRRILSALCTRQRMEALRPAVRGLVTEHIDAMLAEHAGTADLGAASAHPIAFGTIATLLGIPADERRFTSPSEIEDLGPEDAIGIYLDTIRYLEDLVRRRRVEHSDDLLGRLAQAGELGDAELANIGMMLIIGGTETSANMMLSAVMVLLENPAALRAYREARRAGGSAIDELVRYLSVSQVVMPPRTATTDVELAGVTIRAGETVAVSLLAANRDPAAFRDPDVLDFRRADVAGHLGFGYGIHRCLGAHLARIELDEFLHVLFDRLPGLALVEAPADIEMREEEFIYGPRSLVVRW